MSLLQIFCLKLLKHRNQVYVQFYTDFPTRMENLIKIEILSMTNLLGYQNGTDATEWFIPIPPHIKKEKIIGLNCLNQSTWFEYCVLDIHANCIRVGGKGNFTGISPNLIKVQVSYL